MDFVILLAPNPEVPHRHFSLVYYRSYRSHPDDKSSCRSSRVLLQPTSSTESTLEVGEGRQQQSLGEIPTAWCSAETSPPESQNSRAKVPPNFIFLYDDLARRGQ